MTVICSSCLSEKEVSAFPSKGRICNACKAADRRRRRAADPQRARAAVARWRAAHPEQTRAMSRRWRGANIDHIQEYRRSWSATNTERERASSARWHAANGERRRMAQHAAQCVYRAVRSGKLVRPSMCEGCGITGAPIEAAHHDYSRPLDVRWLCLPCHRRWDAAEPKTKAMSA